MASKKEGRGRDGACDVIILFVGQLKKSSEINIFNFPIFFRSKSLTCDQYKQ